MDIDYLDGQIEIETYKEIEKEREICIEREERESDRGERKKEKDSQRQEKREIYLKELKIEKYIFIDGQIGRKRKREKREKER